MKEAWQLGQVSIEDYHRLAGIRGVKSERLPAGRMLEAKEVLRLFSACRKDENVAAGRRDAAIAGLMIAGGLRRSEVAALDAEHIDLSSGEVRLLSAKGDKDRLTYLGSDARAMMVAWAESRGNWEGTFIAPVDRFGNVNPRGMTTQAVYNAMRKRAAQADVHFSPHDLRRTYVSMLLDGGADIATVQGLAGHSSPSTTARYDRRGERAKQSAAEIIKLGETVVGPKTWAALSQIVSQPCN